MLIRGDTIMPKKRIRKDMKVSELKRNRVVGIPRIKHGAPQPGITKKEFMDVLARTVPPVSHDSESDSESSQT
jgi:hypothetical protein